MRNNHTAWSARLTGWEEGVNLLTNHRVQWAKPIAILTYFRHLPKNRSIEKRSYTSGTFVSWTVKRFNPKGCLEPRYISEFSNKHGLSPDFFPDLSLFFSFFFFSEGIKNLSGEGLTENPLFCNVHNLCFPCHWADAYSSISNRGTNLHLVK